MQTTDPSELADPSQLSFLQTLLMCILFCYRFHTMWTVGVSRIRRRSCAKKFGSFCFDWSLMQASDHREIVLPDLPQWKRKRTSNNSNNQRHDRDKKGANSCFLWLPWKSDIQKHNKNFHKFFNRADIPWVHLIWENIMEMASYQIMSRKVPFGGEMFWNY